MNWCSLLFKCHDAEEYREMIATEQNPAERKMLDKEYFENCQHNHEGCNHREILLGARK